MTDYKNLDNAEQNAPLVESLAEEGSFIDLDKYSRPKSEEVTAQSIVNFIDLREKAVHVYSDDLRVNGEVVEDSFEKYLGAAKYLSSSFLKKGLLTPRHLYFEQQFNSALSKFKKESSSFNLGTFIHEAILEPTKFSRVFVEPDFGISKNSTEHWFNLSFAWYTKLSELDIECEVPVSGGKRDDYKNYVESCKVLSGIESISSNDGLKIKAIKQALDQYGGGILHDILKRSKREISMYTEDAETGLNVRIRPDAIQFKENIGVDTIISVKSTSCPDLKKFMYDCAKYNYDLSEAMYQDVASEVTGRDFRNTLMIMVQTVEPFGIALVKWSSEDIAGGRYKYRTALERVLSYQEDGCGMSYDIYAEEGNRGIIDSALPWWSKSEIPAYNIRG